MEQISIAGGTRSRGGGAVPRALPRRRAGVVPDVGGGAAAAGGAAVERQLPGRPAAGRPGPARPRCCADPWLRRRKPRERLLRRAGSACRRARDLPAPAARRCAGSPGARCCAWGRARSAGAPPSRWRPSCRRWPTPACEQAVAVCDARAARRLRRADLGRAAPVVRGAGHGQAGRRGAELLVGRRPRLPLLDRRGRGGHADACTSTTPACRRW